MISPRKSKNATAWKGVWYPSFKQLYLSFPDPAVSYQGFLIRMRDGRMTPEEAALTPRGKK
jgi:hypothetical protein